MKILTVVGARPQFVKAFPVSNALGRSHAEVLVHTGQHYDEELSAVFFDDLDIPTPDYHLGVGSGPHGEQTGRMMIELEAVAAREEPDLILIYGDTNSTLAGALVAAKTDPRLVHVEAGLRSDDWAMPEEVNRVIADHCSDLLFAPMERAARNLAAEGITDGVFVSGDVMYDALRTVRRRGADRTAIRRELGIDGSEYILATVHRAANTDCPERLAAIVDALCAVPDPVVFPAHPRTVEALERDGLWDRVRSGVVVTEPLGYLEFVGLLAGATRVATDSGGVQKEAFYLDTPCVTLRETTEWLETVECGWNVLAGADRRRIVEALTRDPPPGPKPDLYGNGQAAERIVEAIDDA